MLRASSIAIVFVSAFFSAHDALAQAQPSDAAKAMAGPWEISNADRDKICIVTFHAQTARGGLKLEFDQACGEAFPLTNDVVAWSLTKDGLRFVDTNGKTVLDLDEVERGLFEGERVTEGRYFMQNLASAGAVPVPEQVFGDWGISRGSDTPICVITLSDKSIADNFALELKPGCDASVTGFNPISWRLERGELVLSSAKGVWRFEEAGQIAWRRVPEGTEPLWLVRQQ
jgi:hypothetical protein